MTKPKEATATPRASRRRWLIGLGSTMALGLGAAQWGWPRLARPAAPDGPMSAGARAFVKAAWKGLDAKRVLDCHVHMLGLGKGGSGCFVHPKMQSWSHPRSYARFDIYRRAAGIDDLKIADQQYRDSLVNLMGAQSPHGRLLLLAFDKAYRDDGVAMPDATTFFVPNDYVLSYVRKHPKLFLACASIHPYRRDAVRELERVASAGACCIKWLPNAMHIDPASARCDDFYRALTRLGLPLLTHAGDEAAVEVREAQRLGNPLRLRRALDAGVKVIVCHCASTGLGEDLDAPAPDKPAVANFDLFLRLMADGRYADRLYGDISALTQYNRCERPLRELLDRPELHPRLINGSDYPLVAINALVRTSKLVSLGYIQPSQRQFLDEIDRHNPLSFDFVLKRSLRGPAGHGFGDGVFQPPPGLFSGV